MRKQIGITLIELMIVVAIVGLLAAIAYPSYAQYVQRSKRVTAEGDLYALRNAMQRELPENNNCLLYTSPSPRDLSTSRMPSSA